MPTLFIFYCRYYFNKDSGTCQQFYYGGCGGNKNNFKTEKSCRSRCSADFSIPVIEDFRLEFCFLSKDAGMGYEFLQRYTYHLRYHIKTKTLIRLPTVLRATPFISQNVGAYIY